MNKCKICKKETTNKYFCSRECLDKFKELKAKKEEKERLERESEELMSSMQLNNQTQPQPQYQQLAPTIIIHNSNDNSNKNENKNENKSESLNVNAQIQKEQTHYVPRPMISESEYKRKTIILYLLWLLLGMFGAHRFYLGDNKLGLLMLITLGGGGIWWAIDIFLILGRHKQFKYGLNYKQKYLR